MPLPPNPPTREFVTLSALAEDVLGLSRARVYELIERGALPHALYDLRSRRPLFNADLQRQALAVRQTGVGIDGSPVIFYRRERRITPAPAVREGRRLSPTRPQPRHTELVNALQALGVGRADEPTVAAAVAECYPHGTAGQPESDVIRCVFRHLRSRERV